MVHLTTENAAAVWGFVGAAFSMGMGAIGTGIGIGMGGAEAARASARQPSGHSDIFKTMLIGQAVTETAAIFSLMVSVLLLFAPLPGGHLSGAAGRLGAGFCMGFGAFGSGVGAGLANALACRAVGRRPETTGDVTTTMLIGQSVAQSSAIFALIIALLLTFEPTTSSDIVTVCKFIGAGLCMGFGALGPGYGSGVAAMYGVFAVACNVRQKPAIMRTMLLGQAVSQSTATYSLVIALLLIFAM
jgi:F-type H+-transporting ATPase subunit c